MVKCQEEARSKEETKPQAAIWLVNLFNMQSQSWDCSKVDNELEERDAMDWLKDGELMRQWEKVNKEMCGRKAASGESEERTRTPGGASTKEEKGAKARRRRGRWQVGSQRCWERL